MAPSAQAGGGRGQAPAAGIRHGIRAVLLGPPGAGKGTQVRAMRSEERAACPAFPSAGARCVTPAGVRPGGARAGMGCAVFGWLRGSLPCGFGCIPPPGARWPRLFVPGAFVPGEHRGSGSCHVLGGQRLSRCRERGTRPGRARHPQPQRSGLISVLFRRPRSWPRLTACATWLPATCCGPWWPRAPSWASGSRRRWTRGSWWVTGSVMGRDTGTWSES